MPFAISHLDSATNAVLWIRFGLMKFHEFKGSGAILGGGSPLLGRAERPLGASHSRYRQIQEAPNLAVSAGWGGLSLAF